MKKEEAKNELAEVKAFELVTGYEGIDDDLKSELQDEMGDLDDEVGISARHVKSPTGEGSSFEVETDDPDDTEAMKTIEGVILFTHRMNSYWEKPFGDDDGNKAPDCSSIDAKKGIEYGTGEIKDCETCPMNRFADDGSRKKCKNMRRIYFMMSGRPEIYMLSVPPTSIKDINKQLVRIMGAQKTPYTRMLIRFSLKKAVSKGGGKYSKVVLEKAGMIPEALFEKTSELRKAIKDKYKEVAITQDDYNVAEDGADPDAAAGAPDPKTDSDGFMNVPDGIQENLPFN